MVTGDDFVLPEEALPGFRASLPQSRLVNLAGMNHYSIVMQACSRRDRAIIDFLAE